MSGTVIEEPIVTHEDLTESRRPGPDLSKLEDHTPPALRAPRAVAGLVFCLGLVYLFFGLQPVWHTDIWGHLSYGKVIWEARSIPVTEPLMPLAAGMEFVDTAWLSQILGYLTYNTLGIAGVQGEYALAVTFCAALVTFAVYCRTCHGPISLLTMAGFLAMAWVPLTVVRPQVAGLFCFVVLLVRMSSRRRGVLDWVLIPVLFAAWANLHGSFPVGLFLLGAFVAGRAWDLLRRTGSLRVLLGDSRLRRDFLLMELAIAATLLNPYGIGVYPAALAISRHPNLNDLTEWFPLTLDTAQGVLFGLSVIGLMVLYRLSPRRVASWEVLALGVLGWGTLTSARLIVWWAPVAALVAATHGYAIWRSRRHLSLIPQAQTRAGKWSVVAVGLIWIFFAYSPLGVRLVHGKPAKLERSVSTDTPLAAVKYLNRKPPRGLIFNTYEWGDYLKWAGPADLKIFVNSHAHLVPRDVWQAYLQISDAQGNWEELLDRYGVNTVVVDRQFRESLIRKLRESDKWKQDFEQDGQVVFLRRSPIL